MTPKLETLFPSFDLSEEDVIKSIYIINSKLISENTSLNDLNDIINIMQKYLQYTDIKDYVIFLIRESLNSLNKESYNFKQYIKYLVLLDNTEINEIIETHLIVRKNIKYFFIYLQEKLSQNKSILNCEKHFIHLMTFNFDIEHVNKYLLLLNKNYFYLMRRFIEMNQFTCLEFLINRIIRKNKSEIINIVPFLIFNFPINNKLLYNYINIVESIASHSYLYYDQLLYNDTLINLFETKIINAFPNLDAIESYSLYLYYKNNELYLSFESKILKVLKPYYIMKFAEHISFSSKKLIILKLLELKDKENTAIFLKTHPQYNNLLPMM